MVSGPFLLPFHTQPIGSFRGEWWAAALGLAAAVAGLSGSRRVVPLPAMLLLPASLLAVMLLQFLLGQLVFPQLGLLYAAYLLWAGLLMVLGRHLADTLGLARLADVLAAGVALGAMMGAAAALVQWLGVADRVPWVFPKLGGSAYGNLGQANHHAHYSWLGIASLLYLRGRRHLSRSLLWLLILPIAFGSVLSGARSVFIYPLVLLAAMAWLRIREPHGPAPSLLADAVLLLPAAIALSFVGAWATPQLPGLAVALGLMPSGDSGAVVAGARLFESVSGISARLEIGRSAWSAFAGQPWLGQGVGNYAWASFVAASGHTGDDAFMVSENAHNFVLQIMAEFGGPAAAIVVLALGVWAMQFLRQPWRLEQFWCGAVLGIGLVHALLEYPLWYAYFLGPTALLLGAAGTGRAIGLPGRRAAVYLLVIACGGAVFLANLRADYLTIEAAKNRPLAAHPDRERAWRTTVDQLLELHRESLLSPWALLSIANLAEPGRQLAADRADLCERAIRFVPARLLVTRCAMQMAIAGRDADAKTLIRSVLHAFPAERADTAGELAKGAREFPEIAPLRGLSLGK